MARPSVSNLPRKLKAGPQAQPASVPAMTYAKTMQFRPGAKLDASQVKDYRPPSKLAGMAVGRLPGAASGAREAARDGAREAGYQVGANAGLATTRAVRRKLRQRVSDDEGA